MAQPLRTRTHLLPRLLQFLVLAPALAQVGPDALSVPKNVGYKQGALKGTDGQFDARQQQQCVNPGWVPACGGSLPCRPPDAECCGLYYYYPEEEFCCPDLSGSCALGTTCCVDVCCKAGATCSGGTCVRATAPASRTAPSATSSAKRTSSTSAVATPTVTSATSPSRTTSTDAEACTVPAEKRAALPTMTVPYQETYAVIPGSGGRKTCLDNRELMNSMCKGIKKARNCASNQMQLKFRPDLGDSNRSKMCPDGFCRPENVDCDPANPSKPCNPYSNFVPGPLGRKYSLTCDEFPFAKSLQGGTGTSICIPGWQNSFQGGKLNRLGDKVGAGKDYILEVTGWDCKTGRPTAGSVTNCAGMTKRDELGGESLTQDDFFTNFTDTGEHALMMYLGDIDPGVYTYTLHITTGTFTDVRAIDSEGDTIGTPAGSLKAGSGAQVVTVEVTAPAYGVALWAFTADTKVSVSYNATSLPLSNTTATAPSSSGVPSATGTARPAVAEGGRSFAVGVGALVAVGMAVAVGVYV